MRREPERGECRLMLGRAVADIGRPAIALIALGQAPHEAVARHLGDDRGGGDREREPVAADDGAHGAGEGRRAVAVDERDLRQSAQGAERELLIDLTMAAKRRDLR